MEIPAYSDLLDLQEVDLEIDRLLHQRSSLPELDEYRAVDDRRKEAETEVAAIRDRQRAAGLELDKAEGELEIIEVRLQEAETRLYAGGMSGKETEHKRLEVQSLRGQQEALETRVLQLIDSKELVDAELAEAEKKVSELAAREAELESVIKGAWKEIDAVLHRREARKAEIVPSIPNDLLELYETMRKTKEGVAIGRFEAGQCGGCHLQLSPTEQVEARNSDPPRCVHCRRLIVF